MRASVQWQFSLYFMGTVPAGITLPEDPTSEEAVALLWKWPGVLLELTQCVGVLRTATSVVCRGLSGLQRSVPQQPRH